MVAVVDFLMILSSLANGCARQLPWLHEVSSISTYSQKIIQISQTKKILFPTQQTSHFVYFLMHRTCSDYSEIEIL